MSLCFISRFWLCYRSNTSTTRGFWTFRRIFFLSTKHTFTQSRSESFTSERISVLFLCRWTRLVRRRAFCFDFYYHRRHSSECAPPHAVTCSANRKIEYWCAFVHFYLASRDTCKCSSYTTTYAWHTIFTILWQPPGKRREPPNSLTITSMQRKYFASTGWMLMLLTTHYIERNAREYSRTLFSRICGKHFG